MSDGSSVKEPKPVNDIKARIDRMELKLTRPRLITIIAVDNTDGTFELIYGFHYNNQYTDVRYLVKAEDELDSLSSYYAAAVNMEREVVDMMGLHFKGIEGGLLLTPGKGIVAPLRKPLKQAVPPPPSPGASPAAPIPSTVAKEVEK
jgi:NADH:ubiquinone oxidoreductase subunit C